MVSDMLKQLWDNGIIQLGIWETVYMTLLSTLIAYGIGLPIGVILCITDKDGIHPNRLVNRSASS